MFWTDRAQASDRLTGAIVLYDKNKPFYIRDILTPEGGGEIGAFGYFLTNVENYENIPLSDEKWNNFRDLPPLGWVNFFTGNRISPYYLQRKATNTRTHGISNRNTVPHFIKPEDSSIRPTDRTSTVRVMSNEGYLETLEDGYEFPLLDQVLVNIPEKSAIAISRKFCVSRCSEGVRWFFRKKTRIGLFAGVNTLTLLPNKAFYREEIQNEPSFNIDDIQEF